MAVQFLGKLAAGQNAAAKEVERMGFSVFSLIVAALFVVFIILTCVNVKEKSTVDMKTATIGEMFRALLQNDQTMTVVGAIVLINTAVYVTSNLVIYFFKYDFGGTGWYGSYTLFNTFGGGIQILSMMLFYPMLRRTMTSIRIFYVSLFMAAAGYLVLLGLTFTGMQSVFILFVPAFFIFASVGMLNVLTTVFLANTVDYGELKNKRRDESVIFSMQTFVVKLASGIAAFIASVCLQINALSNAATTEAEQSVDFSQGVSQSARIGLRMTMSVLPMIGLIAAIILFRKKYILTDEKLKEIAGKIK